MAFPLAYMDEVARMAHEQGCAPQLQVAYHVYEVEDDGAYFIDVAIRDRVRA